MAIAQETEGRSIGGFMKRSQDYWDKVRAADLQDEMRKQREAQAEAMKKAQSGGDKEEDKKDNKPASQRGLNAAPSSSILPEGGMGARQFTNMATNAGVGGSTGTQVSYGSQQAALMHELTSRGVKPEVAAGAVGSMMGESGTHLNPSVYGYDVNGPSGGFAQWHDVDGKGGRFSSLLNYAGMSKDQAVQGGKLTIPFETQAKFLGHELDTTHKGVLDSLLKGNTVADGNRIWTKDFEVPAHANAQVSARQHHGDNFWSYWQKNGDALAAQGTPSGASRNIDAGTPTNRAANDGSYRVASDTTTMNDASPPQPQQVSGATQAANSATPQSMTPSTTTATTPTNQPMSAPLPPRRPENLGASPEFPDNRGQEPGMPPRRPEMGPPMPEQSGQPAAVSTQAAQSGDGGGFFKDISSIFGDGKDANGREWDALYGYEKPPEEAPAAASASAASAASAPEGKSILDFGSIGDDIGNGMSDAFNWFSSIFQ